MKRCDLASSIDLVDGRLKSLRSSHTEGRHVRHKTGILMYSLYADLIIICQVPLINRAGPQPFKHHWYQIGRTAKLRISCQDWPAPPNPILVIFVQPGFVGDTLLLTCSQTVRMFSEKAIVNRPGNTGKKSDQSICTEYPCNLGMGLNLEMSLKRVHLQGSTVIFHLGTLWEPARLI